MRKLVPHFVSFWHDYHTTRTFIKIVIYKSGDHHVNKLTDNDFNKINYTDHFVVTFPNPTYYTVIMLDAFNNLLCSELCWHNRPEPSSLQYSYHTHMIK